MRPLKAVLGVFGGSIVVAAFAAGPAPVAAASSEIRVAAAGDIACAGEARATRCRQQATSDLLVGAGYTAVLALGDAQYDCGRLSDFQRFYDPTWGRVKSITRPVPGDGEYAGGTCSTPGAEGYFTYFGSAATPLEPDCTRGCRGYYSYDLDNWHVVALNTECAQVPGGGCSSTSEQVQWLKSDLAANTSTCTLAYFHHPRWGNGGMSSRPSQFIKALYADRAEIVLSGHSHVYLRYAPQTPTGAASANGLRQFVVGTGGKSLSAVKSPALPNLEKGFAAYGVLELTLGASSYDWRFIAENGQVLDQGSTPCR